MPQQPGPWAELNPLPPKPEPPRPSGHRLLIWVALLLAGALGIVALFRIFPGAVTSHDMPYMVRMLALLAFLSAGVVFARRVSLGEAARNIAVWIGIGAVLMLGYTFRDDLAFVGNRVQSEFLPADPVSSGGHVLAVTQDEGGDFYLYGTADGVRIRFLIDTGASGIVLSPSDASRMGIDLVKLHFSGGYETANGMGAGAPWTIRTLAVGPIQQWNVPASINKTDMHASLLGMSFLRRLKSFEISGRKLYLRW